MSDNSLETNQAGNEVVSKHAGKGTRKGTPRDTTKANTARRMNAKEKRQEDLETLLNKYELIPKQETPTVDTSERTRASLVNTAETEDTSEQTRAFLAETNVKTQPKKRAGTSRKIDTPTEIPKKEVRESPSPVFSDPISYKMYHMRQSQTNWRFSN